jgi:hypothetical protein
VFVGTAAQCCSGEAQRCSGKALQRQHACSAKRAALRLKKNVAIPEDETDVYLAMRMAGYARERVDN